MNKKRFAFFVSVILIGSIMLNTGCTSHQSQKENTKNTTSGESNMIGSDNNVSVGRGITYDGMLDNAITDSTVFIGNSGKPDFTQEQIKSQKDAGRIIIEDLKKAAADLSVSSYTIPAGNYGFDMNITAPNGVDSGIIIEDINRPSDNPFVIKANAVTFWFELSGYACPNVTRGLHFVGCSNIYIEGLTIDSYTANDIEGEIVSIDRSGNRIGIKLYDGTMSLDFDTLIRASKGSEFRILPVKKSGELISPLYNINNQWGPESLWGKTLTVDDEGICWFTFKTNTLMNTIFEDSWLDFYGKNGTIEIGDKISILYGVVISISLDNCAQMRVIDLKSYIAKGGFWENGGYGDHLWKDCYFGPRPGTNRILGGDCNLAQGLRHGSTYDGLVYGLTSDDALNLHGFWSEIERVNQLSAGKYEVKCLYAPVGITIGDIAEFYNKESGELIDTCTVVAEPVANFNYNGFLSGTIILNEVPSSDNYDNMYIRWPNSECDGFVIRNCHFINNYQRVLINSGSGTIENNTFIDNGSNLALTSSTLIYEGGVMKGITIKNNVFYNTANHPGGKVIDIYQTSEWSEHLSAENLSLSNNIFVNCGSIFAAENVKDLSINGNIIINPMLYGKEVKIFEDTYTLKKSTINSCENNSLYIISEAQINQISDICHTKTLSSQEMAEEITNILNNAISE